MAILVDTVRPDAVTPARGGASKHKAFEVAGIERPALFARVRAAAEAVAGRAPSKDA